MGEVNLNIDKSLKSESGKMKYDVTRYQETI